LSEGSIANILEEAREEASDIDDLRTLNANLKKSGRSPYMS